MTPKLVLYIGYLLSGLLVLLARFTGQLCLNDTSGLCAEQGVVDSIMTNLPGIF